jgi:hypothetical protein
MIEVCDIGARASRRANTGLLEKKGFMERELALNRYQNARSYENGLSGPTLLFLAAVK